MTVNSIYLSQFLGLESEVKAPAWPRWVRAVLQAQGWRLLTVPSLWLGAGTIIFGGFIST